MVGKLVTDLLKSKKIRQILKKYLINRHKFNIITLIIYIICSFVKCLRQRPKSKKGKRMNKDIKEVKLNKYKGSLLLKIALVCLAVYLVFILISQQSQVKNKQAEFAALQNEIKLQQEVNDEIEYSIEKNASGADEYAEEYARSELGYVKQGERVFVDIGGN